LAAITDDLARHYLEFNTASVDSGYRIK